MMDRLVVLEVRVVDETHPLVVNFILNMTLFYKNKVMLRVGRDSGANVQTTSKNG